jgi:hypothetical protein
MSTANNALWLIVAVALGLMAYSLVGIAANGFQMHMLYPLLMGFVNLAAFFMLRKQ